MSRYREEEVEETLKDQFKEIIDEMPEDVFLEFTKQLFSQTWVQGQSNVLCALQNNMKLIGLSYATQCSSCGKWFCIDHNLENCTYCNAQMP